MEIQREREREKEKVTEKKRERRKERREKRDVRSITATKKTHSSLSAVSFFAAVVINV